MHELSTDEFLHEAEIDSMPPEYRFYFGTKRNNFVASITGQPELWQLYLGVDAVFHLGIKLMQVGNAAPIEVFPLTLYFVAHAKTRIAMELAFSGCYQEMRSVLRDALESAVHAHYMLTSPEIQAAWRDKYDGRNAVKIYNQHFTHNKLDKLWKGLDDLYEQYGQLSDMGSHPTLRSFYNRVQFSETPDAGHSQVHYTGGATERTWVPEVLSMIMICSRIEDLFFTDFANRLGADSNLVQMRKMLHSHGMQVRRSIVERYKIQPPADAGTA